MNSEPAAKKKISILNDVLGPVMRGPSSSHSAAPFAIANSCRQLSTSNGEKVTKARVRFDHDGSIAHVHTEQGADEGFAAGLLGTGVESDEYLQALPLLRSAASPFDFKIETCSLKQVDHPNLIEILLTCLDKTSERTDTYLAVSSGGGTFSIFQLNGQDIALEGAANTVLIECNKKVIYESALNHFPDKGIILNKRHSTNAVDDIWSFQTQRALSADELASLADIPFIIRIREAAPAQLTVSGEKELFASTREVLELCADHSLPEIAVLYESELLGLSKGRTEKHFLERAQLMVKITEKGLQAPSQDMQLKLLKPSAGRIANSEAAKKLAGNSIHNAICGALSVMETSGTRGVVCACPTAGSAGILPGCLYSLRLNEYSTAHIADALKVAGIVGKIIAERATFAGSVAGCAVEAGSAAAMAAAGLAYIMDEKSVEAPFSAAALCLMNNSGLVCDPVKGEVEVPCHARNIAGVGHAFTAATASIGGFNSYIPFDEVVDSMLEVGKTIPPSLRCTSQGGLATCPTACGS